MKTHLSEQLIGVIVAALLIGAIIACMHIMNRNDDARRNTLAQRQHRKEVQDSNPIAGRMLSRMFFC